ncbi:MAG: ATP-binding cassette domain-containing protein [Alphaproteobacteria bacterium]|nr:ATP-binding cassette domain-containing protein [Alphaproteobacteria bacterium]
MLKVDSLVYSWAHGPTLHYDLEVSPGEIVVLRGPSGAGKSTLLSLIAGFIAPSAGRITWHGESLLGVKPDRRPITSLFQSGNLFEHLDAFTNVALGLHPGARLDRAQEQQVVQTFASLGLAGLERRRPGKLSGGQQQRVALARALVRARPILLLDEPFTALDPDTRHDILALLRKLVIANNLATIVVSHDGEDSRLLEGREVGIATHEGLPAE